MTEGLNILTHESEGYAPVHDFGAWRTAILKQGPRFNRATATDMERHRETDEVFVLLCGEATLVIGDEMTEVKMEKEKVYNIQKGVWHSIFVSADAKVFIVENADTTRENTDRRPYPYKPDNRK